MQLFVQVVIVIGLILFISIILGRDTRKIPVKRKSCYTNATSAGKMKCSETIDSAFFPMESEDYVDAYEAARRYCS